MQNIKSLYPIKQNKTFYKINFFLDKVMDFILRHQEEAKFTMREKIKRQRYSITTYYKINFLYIKETES